MNTHDNRHLVMIQSLATRAINLAIDASPHRAPPGQVRRSLTASLPAATMLLGLTANDPPMPPDSEDVVFVDGRGQGRFSYRPLSRYLHHRATGQLAVSPRDSSSTPANVAMALWDQWQRAAAGAFDERAIDAVVMAGGDCLKPQAADEAPDHWTYCELVGLHALQAIIELYSNDDEQTVPPRWRQRVIEITDYHQQHTQPDYTTVQPWALAAFLSNPQTTWFAEQQLHDVQTHLQIEGGPGAVVPALLLADAYASISA